MRPFLLLLALLLGAPAALAAKTILVVGDSLSAGYGLRPEQAWPSLLAGRLAEQGTDYSVVNISISGETTAGGLSRLGPALQAHRPAVVVIALGANDGLRGLTLDQMRNNLDAMIAAAQKTSARVLLIGMRLPPNYGPYADQFQAVFTDLAGFDEIIDARSPAEFAEDHLPGARNCPVLDNAQRAEVGTLYKQCS
ncbi:MAG: GDSL-type esterase/lipase family protein, partial [Azonexus sp.]|uniref:arylesterase n=1 Tax=Azonexus sp. TaxID=1872668 RepID=UPI0028376D5E